MLFKNVASQKALVFAFDKTTGAAKTGDAANITASVSKDGAASSASNDTNPTEIGGGWYAFDLTQAETNCDLFLLYSASATSNILVNGVSGYTTGGSIPQAGVAAAATALSTAQWTNTRAGLLDNLNATVSSRAESIATVASLVSADIKLDSIYEKVDTEIGAIKAKTDNLPASPAAVGSAMTLTTGERTSVADALLNRDMSTGTDDGSATVRTVRQALRFLRNKWSISGTTLTVTKEDDTTASWTAEVSTNAGASPITGSDPASS